MWLRGSLTKFLMTCLASRLSPLQIRARTNSVVIPTILFTDLMAAECHGIPAMATTQVAVTVQNVAKRTKSGSKPLINN